MLCLAGISAELPWWLGVVYLLWLESGLAADQGVVGIAVRTLI
mgnify:FL=1